MESNDERWRPTSERSIRYPPQFSSSIDHSLRHRWSEHSAPREPPLVWIVANTAPMSSHRNRDWLLHQVNQETRSSKLTRTESTSFRRRRRLDDSRTEEIDRSARGISHNSYSTVPDESLRRWTIDIGLCCVCNRETISMVLRPAVKLEHLWTGDAK